MVSAHALACNALLLIRFYSSTRTPHCKERPECIHSASARRAAMRSHRCARDCLLRSLQRLLHVKPLPVYRLLLHAEAAVLHEERPTGKRGRGNFELLRKRRARSCQKEIGARRTSEMWGYPSHCENSRALPIGLAPRYRPACRQTR
jgi:hypothetical protein